MNFLRSSNKQNLDPTATKERRGKIPALIATGMAGAALFLAGCAEAKEPAPAPPATSTTTEAAPVTTAPQPTPEHKYPDSINTQVIKNIQEQAHERWPGKTCAFAFYKGGKLNVDVTDQSLMAAIEEFAYQGNPDIVPQELAGREPAGTYHLSEDQKAVIHLSAQFIAEQTGHIDEPGGRIGLCKVPQGTALETTSAFIVLDRGPSTEVTNK